MKKDVAKKTERFFEKTFSLDEDRATNEEIHSRIQSGAKFRGSNMCMLVLAIIIASIGLNMNSTAVVIGAMLISPLMGCIMGIGYGIATNHIKFARNSAISLMIQVIICIITSTIYFKISPISTTSHELLARTTPTIWDVLIAIAGGLAGIIGITRKEKSNVLPGVAIATAIMPPLCTAGYGIATGNASYFGGAMYLFCINAFFICLSTIILIKIMKIPVIKPIETKESRRLRIELILLTIVVIIPSIVFAYNIVSETVKNNNIQRYIDNEYNYENTQVIDSKSDLKKKEIDVYLIGQIIDDEQIAELTKKLKEYNLSDMTLKIIQTEYEEGISESEVKKLIQAQLENSDKKLSSIQTSVKSDSDDTLTDKLKDIKSEVKYDTNNIITELKKITGKIKDVSVTKNTTTNQATQKETYSLYISIKITEDISEIENEEIETKLKDQLGDNITVKIDYEKE